MKPIIKEKDFVSFMCVAKQSSENINIDLDDIKMCFQHYVPKVVCVTGREVEKCTQSFVNDYKIENCNIIVFFECSNDYPLDMVHESLGILHDNLDEDANVVFGLTYSNKLDYLGTKMVRVWLAFKPMKQ